MHDARKPDAIRAPLSVAPYETARERLHALRERFAPALGADVVYVGRLAGDPPAYFLAPRSDQCLLFPVGHPRHPAPRYAWLARGGGIEYGYLVPGAAEAVIGDDPDGRAPGAKATPDPRDQLAAMVARGDLSAEDAVAILKGLQT